MAALLNTKAVGNSGYTFVATSFRECDPQCRTLQLFHSCDLQANLGKKGRLPMGCGSWNGKA